MSRDMCAARQPRGEGDEVARASAHPDGAGEERFRLDRARLREHLIADYGEAVGLDPCDERGLAGSIVCRLLDAQDRGAIEAPENVEINAYALDDSVLIAVREVKVAPGSRAYARQLSTYAIETRYLTDGDTDFAECCETLEECLRRARELLGALRLLQAAEGAGERR